METRETGPFTVKFENNPEIASKVYEKLIDWYFKHESFCGETIMQCDDSPISSSSFRDYVCDDGERP